MNSIFLQRMREQRGWFFKMSAVYGVIFTLCLYRNMSAITFPMMTFFSLWISVSFLRKAGITLQKDTMPYFAGISLLGVSTVLTDSMFFHFFNIVGIILLFMMAMAHQLYRDDEWGFPEYVKKFFIMTGTWLLSVEEVFHCEKKKTQMGDNKENSVENFSSEKKKWRKVRNSGPVLLGVAAAVLLLIIVLPLLMMSDEIFGRIFREMFGFVNPFRVFADIDFGTVFGIVFTFLFGMIFLYAFFAGLFKMNLGGKEEKKQGKTSYITGITFTGIMAAVYVLYSGIQILFLFFRLESGLPEGITYSQYAHQGFWQLLFVSIINFVTVLICVRIFQENRILKILLTVISVCTCIMILSAAYRMILYVEEYNLSFLRVLVLWFLAVLMLIFFGVIFGIFRKEFRLFRYITFAVSVCYILFSFSRADAFIAGYNISNAEDINKLDIEYLMYGLSEDAAGELARIEPADISDIVMRENLEIYFQEILLESRNASLREWNYSRFTAAKNAEQWLDNRE